MRLLPLSCVTGFGFLLSLAGCGASPTPNDSAKPIVARAKVRGPLRIIELENAYVPPETAVRGAERLFVWAKTDRDKGGWRVEARTLVRGEASPRPTILLGRGEEVSQIIARALPERFVVAWVEGVGLRTRIVVSKSLESVDPVTLAAPRKDVLWLEIVPNAAGLFLVWAERGEDEAAEIRALRMSSELDSLNAPISLAVGTLAWQVASVKGDLALLTIDRERQGDVLHYRTFSGTLAPKEDKRISNSAAPEIDLHPDGDSVDVAWTDTSGLDPHVLHARFGGPTSATEGARSFLSFAGTKLLVRSEEAGEGKCVRALDESASLEASPCFVQVPDASTNGETLYLEGNLRASPLLGDEPRRTMAPGVSIPTLVAIDFAKKAAHQWALAGVEGVSGLDCQNRTCEGLLMRTVESAHVFEWGELPLSDTKHELAVTASVGAPTTIARARETQALAGDVVDPTGKKPEEWLALLEGEPNSPASVFVSRNVDGEAKVRELVTPRAKAAGGVAISGGGRGAVVLWIGTDGVHLSGLDGTGKRQSDTKLGGDAASRNASLARDRDGWWAAWIDVSGDVVVRRVGLDMRPLGKEGRIGEATKDATELVLSRSGDGSSILAAWIATDKAAPRATDFDVYACALSTKTTRCVERERTVEKTAAPAAHLSMVPHKDGALVAWIDGKISDDRPTVTFARVSPRAVTLDLRHLAGTELYTGVALENLADKKDVDRVGVVLLYATPSGLRLAARDYLPNEISSERPIGWLAGPTSQSLIGSYLAPFGWTYYEGGEVGLGAQGLSRGRLRRFRAR